jgi:hypothetical protein
MAKEAFNYMAVQSEQLWQRVMFYGAQKIAYISQIIPLSFILITIFAGVSRARHWSGCQFFADNNQFVLSS